RGRKAAQGSKRLVMMAPEGCFWPHGGGFGQRALWSATNVIRLGRAIPTARFLRVPNQWRQPRPVGNSHRGEAVVPWNGWLGFLRGKSFAFFSSFLLPIYKLVYNLASMSATIIPFELHLPTILPTIEGNVDYLD